MNPTFVELLARYGYAAVVLGTFVEGESVLIAASLGAHAGVLNVWGVLAAALAGSFFADQMFFYLGRTLGRPFLQKRPKWQRKAVRVYDALTRHDAAFIVAFRFFYGMRSVAPFVVGTSEISARRFFFLNLCGAVVWASAVVTFGYNLGYVLALLPPGALQGRSLYYGLAAAAFVLLAGAVTFFAVRRRRRRKAKPYPLHPFAR